MEGIDALMIVIGEIFERYSIWNAIGDTLRATLSGKYKFTAIAIFCITLKLTIPPNT